jgi:hypothetical protein
MKTKIKRRSLPVVRKGELETTYFWLEHRKGRDNLEDVCVDRRIILELIFKNYDLRMGIGATWLAIGTSSGIL